MNKFSAVIITKNEEKNIERCLKSVQWADEIVVVDSGSTDRTLEICREYGCSALYTEWMGFGRTKKFAVDSANFDWIFSIDADEVVTLELKDKIITILSNQPKYAGYRVKRKSFYLNKLIEYSGWHHDYPLRLFNRKFGNYNDKIVHESVDINGEVGKIEEHLLHYTYPNLSSHIQKIDQYTSLGAQQLFQKEKKSSISKAILRGNMKFFKMYFLQTGFLDGKEGLILAFISSFGIILKYLKLRELWKRN